MGNDGCLSKRRMFERAYYRFWAFTERLGRGSEEAGLFSNLVHKTGNSAIGYLNLNREGRLE